MDSPFVPAQGLVLVTNGSASDVRDAIIEYDGLVREEKPAVFRVELHPQSSGKVAVVLPDGLPAYDLANMTIWLSAPPDQLEVYEAVSWLAAPGNGLQYYLEPEYDNPSGDTLLGSNNLGQSIRVYVPETGVSEISAAHAYEEQPEIEVSPQPVVIELTLDTGTSFGNPRFVVDSPRDHDWLRSWAE